jgi:hypothetical protein
MIIFSAVTIIGIVAGILVWKLAFSSGAVRMRFAKMNASGNNLFRLLNNVEFSNMTPSAVEMKLIALYLAEDIDPNTQNNIGGTEMVWLNPDCTQIDSCTVDKVNSWFDFAENLAVVNAKLNEQTKKIATGSYKYVRMEFCRATETLQNTVPNLRFQAGNMTSKHEFAVNMCGQTSAVADPPIAVSSSSTAEVTLSYSLAGSIRVVNYNCGSSCISTDGGNTYYFPQLILLRELFELKLRN